MVAVVLDGKVLAAAQEAALSERVSGIKKSTGGRVPILATIIVGADPASKTYVRWSRKVFHSCTRVQSPRTDSPFSSPPAPQAAFAFPCAAAGAPISTPCLCPHVSHN